MTIGATAFAALAWLAVALVVLTALGLLYGVVRAGGIDLLTAAPPRANE